MGSSKSRQKSATETHQKLEEAIDKIGEYFEGLDGSVAEKFELFNEKLEQLQKTVLQQITPHQNSNIKILSLHESRITLCKSVSSRLNEIKRAGIKSPRGNFSQKLQFISDWNVISKALELAKSDIKTTSEMQLRMGHTLLLESQNTQQKELLLINPWVYVGYWSITRPAQEIQKPCQIIGSEGTGPTQFRYPFNISIHPTNGRIYVADSENNRIIVLSSSFSPIAVITQPGPNAKPFQDPRGVGISPDGDVIVIVECVGRQIHLLDKEHNLIRSIDRLPPAIPTADSRFYYPYYAVFDRESNFYISDRANNRVLKFDKDGNFLRQIGEPASPHPAASVLGILVNDEGLLLTYPQSGNTLRVYSLDGEFQYQKSLSETRDFNSLARGPDGGFLLCDCSASRIVFYDRDCREIHQVSVRGAMSAVYAPNGQLYVASGYQNHTVQIF